MSRLSRVGWAVMALLGMLLMTGCGGTGEPSLIAAQPQEGGAPSHELEVIQSIWIELEVKDLNAAIGRGNDFAVLHGGFQQDASLSTEGQVTRAVLIYSIPTKEVELARRAFLGLGRVLDESIANQVVPVGSGGGQSFSTITVVLHSPASPTLTLPTLPSTSTLRPARTFQNAFGVFSTLALALLDIVIWLVVVVGPFALVGYGIHALLRRYQFRDGHLVRRELPVAPPSAQPVISSSTETRE
ncbi:MAG: hypothetical protein H0T73_17050 [Ardenticatenales bacterium]|nr:hypothetical protein [Ardenticatenales bacterium]